MSSTGPDTQRPGRPRPTLRMLAIGKFFGVPIYFAPSWLIIAGLLTFYYGPVIDDAVPGLSSSSAYLLAFGYAVAFAFCVLAHEIGHTAMSLVLKRPVVRIVIFLLGGVSEIDNEPERPRDEFLIAAAGPLVSGMITAACAVVSARLDDHSIGGALFLLLFWSNLIVLVFNVLPGLPLDGGRVLRSAVWAVSKSQLVGTRVGAWTGRVVAIGVVVLTLAVYRGPNAMVGGLIGVLLAAYLWAGAGQTLRAAEIMHRLPQLDLDALLRPGLLVPGDLSIDAGLYRLQQGVARGLVLVDSADRPSAIVDEARVRSVAPEQRPWVSLSSVARPLDDGLILHRGLTGEQLLAAIRKTPATEYLVVDEQGAPAGILVTADLAAALGTAR
jgi:Zn-dependent protease